MIQINTIRSEVVALLKAANIPGVEDKVYPSRSRKIWPSEGDLLLVFTQETDADDQDRAPVIYQNSTTLAVRVIVQGADEEDTTDEEEEEIEARLNILTDAVVRAMHPIHGAEGPLNGACDWLKWRGLRPVVSAEGEVLRNSQLVTFVAEWQATLPDDQATDDFLSMGTDLGAPESAKADDLEANFITEMEQ